MLTISYIIRSMLKEPSDGRDDPNRRICRLPGRHRAGPQPEHRTHLPQRVAGLLGLPPGSRRESRAHSGERRAGGMDRGLHPSPEGVLPRQRAFVLVGGQRMVREPGCAEPGGGEPAPIAPADPAPRSPSGGSAATISSAGHRVAAGVGPASPRRRRRDRSATRIAGSGPALHPGGHRSARA